MTYDICENCGGMLKYEQMISTDTHGNQMEDGVLVLQRSSLERKDQKTFDVALRYHAKYHKNLKPCSCDEPNGRGNI